MGASPPDAEGVELASDQSYSYAHLCNNVIITPL